MKPTAKQLVKKLQDAGHRAFWVGGCVRDLVLKQEPKDFDIATSAKPEEIETLFEKSYPIGKKFGVILIEENGHHFEVATFRSDSEYSDGRRPDAVLFSSAEEDAARRDFTINAIFFDPVKEEFFDPQGGRSDLKKGLLKFIGDPEKRIREDFLRPLRAVRFRNRFGLEYDRKTKEALIKHASLVVDVSGERIRDELNKIIEHKSRVSALRDLKKFEMLDNLIPELDQLEKVPQSPNHHSEGNVWEHTLLVQETLDSDASPELRWAALLHDLGKAKTITYEGTRIRFPDHQEHSEALAKQVCERLKFSKKSTDKIIWLIAHHHLFDQWDAMKLVTKLEYFDHPHFLDLMELHQADLKGSVPEEETTKKRDAQQVEKLENDYQYALQNKLLPSHKNELLSGDEIVKISGQKPGPKIGKIKDALRKLQLEGTISSRAEALDWLRNR
ncbi:MAG: CCA tRNA nucleotidyltransferase [Candidatus Gracilibacteria bacterium]|nr:CCA tRNA nucleotidyltransferase [Candidatus Gracilibacteria bacterium]